MGRGNISKKSTVFLTDINATKLIEENNTLATAILEFQRSGKIAEAVEFQKRLHRNLILLIDGHIQSKENFSSSST